MTTNAVSDALRGNAGELGASAAYGAVLGGAVSWLTDMSVAQCVGAAFAFGAVHVAVRGLRLAKAGIEREAAARSLPTRAEMRAVEERFIRQVNDGRDRLRIEREATMERIALGNVRQDAATGASAQRMGGGWLVFSSPDAAPREMNDREYARFRRTARDLVEVERAWEGVRMTRLYLGRVDSSLSGKAAVETFGEDGTLVSSEWYVEGRHSTEEDAMEAHRALSEAAAPGP